jgi:hypothetical protein
MLPIFINDFLWELYAVTQVNEKIFIFLTCY